MNFKQLFLPISPETHKKGLFMTTIGLQDESLHKISFEFSWNA